MWLNKVKNDIQNLLSINCISRWLDARDGRATCTCAEWARRQRHGCPQLSPVTEVVRWATAKHVSCSECAWIGLFGASLLSTRVGDFRHLRRCQDFHRPEVLVGLRWSVSIWRYFLSFLTIRWFRGSLACNEKTKSVKKLIFSRWKSSDPDVC